MSPFDLNLRLTRTLHDGTVEALVSFSHEQPAWIPMRSIEAMCGFINEKLDDQINQLPVS